MIPQEIWDSVLAQLQLEMARASFETWVRDTAALSLEHNLLTVSARNGYARDWLQARTTNPVQRILQDLLQKNVTVRFVAAEEDEEGIAPEEETESEIAIEPVQWLDYDKIVQPHKQVVVKGYLRRLAAEIGPKAIWLYIGFHQAAWKANTRGGPAALHSCEVMRFSGLSFGAFWRLLRDRNTHSQLSGLVQRMDAPHERRYRRGRDGRPHRSPVRYRVCMTPRLTRADAAAVHARLRALLEQGRSMKEALQDLLAMKDAMDLLAHLDGPPTSSPCGTVMEMARLEFERDCPAEIEQLAQDVHRRIVNCLGDIHLTHYFIEQVIPKYNLTPAQAWLVAVARDLAYVNARTGERREIVTFKRGYQEMAELAGVQRYKTIQAWLHPSWKTRTRGGDLTLFLQERPYPDHGYPDLRVASMPRSFRVLLDEPLDATGRIKADAPGSHMADADGRSSQTLMAGVADASGSDMADANGSALNSFKHPANTNRKNTSTAQLADANKAAEAAPAFWELESLLRQNDVHPRVQRELLETQASVHAFVSWILYVASPASGNLSDPLGYALSRLREHPLKEARGSFRQFADLPPGELLGLIDSTSSGGYQIPPAYDHPLAPAWKKTMGSSNRRLPAARAILFGEREE